MEQSRVGGSLASATVAWLARLGARTGDLEAGTHLPGKQSCVASRGVRGDTERETLDQLTPAVLVLNS